MILILSLVILMTSSAHADTSPSLPSCPSSPNCVSSMATDSHRIEPLAVTGDAQAGFEKLKRVLAARKDTTVVAADESSIRVEFRTLLGFVDDGLFVLDVPDGRIHLYSAARLGYWDMGKNRRRMEEIREEYSRR